MRNRYTISPFSAISTRNGGTVPKSGELRPSFDTADANQRINWQTGVVQQSNLWTPWIVPLLPMAVSGWTWYGSLL